MAFIHEEGKKVAKCKHCHMSFTTLWISSKRPHVYIPLCFSKINTLLLLATDVKVCAYLLYT